MSNSQFIDVSTQRNKYFFVENPTLISILFAVLLVYNLVSEFIDIIILLGVYEVENNGALFFFEKLGNVMDVESFQL